jgi:hypothetical protein
MSTIHVSDAHRINELSLLPGGDAVEVVYEKGNSRVYDKIKSPRRYVKALLAKAKNGITHVKVNGVVVWSKI